MFGGLAAFLPLIVGLIAQLPSLIEVAERAFSGKPGSGKAKKDFVVGVTSNAIDIFQKATKKPLSVETVTRVKDTISSTIDSTVSVINELQETEGSGDSFIKDEEDETRQRK